MRSPVRIRVAAPDNPRGHPLGLWFFMGAFPLPQSVWGGLGLLLSLRDWVATERCSPVRICREGVSSLLVSTKRAYLRHRRIPGSTLWGFGFLWELSLFRKASGVGVKQQKPSVARFLRGHFSADFVTSRTQYHILNSQASSPSKKSPSQKLFYFNISQPPSFAQTWLLLLRATLASLLGCNGTMQSGPHIPTKRRELAHVSES